MKTKELIIPVIPAQGIPQKAHKKRRPKTSVWKVFTVAFILSALGAWAVGYEPPPVMRTTTKYEVVNGDTLWSIASKHCDDSQDVREVYWQIMKENNVQAGNLMPGQILTIRR